jgi:hypothetical protein
VSEQKLSLSRRKRAACLRNLRKAWKAPRRKPYVLTPARLEASRANLRQAAEANHLRYKRTPRRRLAVLANLAQAWAANRDHYRATPARQAVSRVTIRSAQAAPRPPESYARSRFNHLKHGLTVRTLEETLDLLGEEPREYKAHCRRFLRVFAPENPQEEKAVRLLAAAVWRRLRLFKAQARWESDALKRLFALAPLVKPLDPDFTRLRAHCLMALLLKQDRLRLHETRLLRVVERELDTLLSLRTGGQMRFKPLLRGDRAATKRIEDLEREIRVYERLASGDPEAWKIAAQLTAKWGLK